MVQEPVEYRLAGSLIAAAGMARGTDKLPRNDLTGCVVRRSSRTEENKTIGGKRRTYLDLPSDVDVRTEAHSQAARITVIREAVDGAPHAEFNLSLLASSLLPLTVSKCTEVSVPTHR